MDQKDPFAKDLSQIIKKAAEDEDFRYIREEMFAEYTPAQLEVAISAVLRETNLTDKGRAITLHLLDRLSTLSKESIEIICSNLFQTSASVRGVAANILGRRKDTFAIEPLIASFNFPGESERQLAKNDEHQSSALSRAWGLASLALGKFQLVAVPFLLAALNNENPHIRFWICDALGYTLNVEEEVVFALSERLLSDQDVDVRHRSAWALGRLQALTSVPALLQAQQDSEAIVRKFVAYALGELGQKKAIIAALSDSSGQVRAAAIYSLAEYFPEDALPFLLHMQNDEDEDVRAQVEYRLSTQKKTH